MSETPSQRQLSSGGDTGNNEDCVNMEAATPTPRKKRTRAEKIAEESQQILKSMGFQEGEEGGRSRRRTRSTYRVASPSPIAAKRVRKSKQPVKKEENNEVPEKISTSESDKKMSCNDIVNDASTEDKEPVDSDVTTQASSTQSSLFVKTKASSPQSSSDVTTKASSTQSSSDVTTKASSPKSSSDVINKASSTQSNLDVTAQASSTQSSLDVTTKAPSTQSSLDVTAKAPSTQSNSDVTTQASSPQSSSDVTTQASSTLSSSDVTTQASSTQSSSDVTTQVSNTQSGSDVTAQASSTQSSSDVTAKASSPQSNSDVTAQASNTQSKIDIVETETKDVLEAEKETEESTSTACATPVIKCDEPSEVSLDVKCEKTSEAETSLAASDEPVVAEPSSVEPNTPDNVAVPSNLHIFNIRH